MHRASWERTSWQSDVDAFRGFGVFSRDQSFFSRINRRGDGGADFVELLADFGLFFFVLYFHLVSPSWVNFTIFYLVSQKSEHIYLVVLELLSVQNESFCYFGNLAFLWLCCFCVRLSSCYHEFEEIFVSSYHSVIDLSFRFWENAVSNKFRVLFVIPCKGEEVVDIRNFTKVRTNGVHED